VLSAQNVKPSSRHLVLLVHGIARVPGTFGGLPKRLRDEGYEAWAISYPSTRGTIADHARQLEYLLTNMEGVDQVSFVTHSMGAIVVRQLLGGDGTWKAHIKPGRVVMIAPPSQGSAVAAFLKDSPAHAAVYGKAGQQLVPWFAVTFPAPKVPFAIIAGGKGDGEGYNPLLPGDDDGTVTVAETKLDGAADFIVLPGIHGFIARSGTVDGPVIRFLASGKFGDDNG
jgi:pimeloyl-ACP methyl ester carboxylesterase